MAKTKKPERSKKRTRAVSRRSGTTYELEHDFIIIAGGGFVVLILIFIFLFR